jgi:hypothetical protein
MSIQNQAMNARRLLPVSRLIYLFAATTGCAVMADTPLLESVFEIHNPSHKVPGEYGWSTYNGTLSVSERFIATYAPYDEQSELLSGMIRIIDRRSLTEIGELRPESPETMSWWGSKLKLSDPLLVVYDGHNSEAFHVYDLTQAGIPKLYSFLSEFSAPLYPSLNATDSLWLVTTEKGTEAFRKSDGTVAGKWEIPGGGISVDGRWMFTTIPSQSWGGIAGYYLADLSQSGVVTDLQTLPGIEPGFRQFYAWQHEGIILIMTTYPREDYGDHKKIYAYDPVTKTMAWHKDDIEDWFHWFRPPVISGQIFVQNPTGGVTVFAATTGEELVTLDPPVDGTLSFGHQISAANGLVFICARDRMFAYNLETLTYLYEVDIQGHIHLDNGFAQEVPGSEHIAFLYNLFNPPIPLFNSVYFNPQILLFNPATGQLTHQLNLNQPMSIGNSTGTYLDPRNFPISIFDAGSGRIGVWSNDYDAQYQLFDPSLSSIGGGGNVVAAVTFSESPGFTAALFRNVDGSEELLAEVAFGGNLAHTIDVSIADHMDGTLYSLHEREIVHVVDNYEKPIPSLYEIVPMTVVGSSVTRYDFLASDASSLVIADVGQSGYPHTVYTSKVTVVDLNTGTQRFSVDPPPAQQSNGFGSRVAVDAQYMAVGDIKNSAVALYDVQTGSYITSFPSTEAFALGEDCLVRLTKQLVNGKNTFSLTCHELPGGLTRFTVEVDYSSGALTLHLSGGYLVLNRQVFDLTNGDYLYTLTSPNPETGDWFGSRVAVDGGKLVAISASQAMGYLFNLADGAHEQTFVLEEWPDGYTNWGTARPTLVLDAESGIFAWGTPSLGVESAIHLFDTETGQRICKLVSPVESYSGGGVFADWSGPVDYGIGEGLALSGDNLWFHFINHPQRSFARLNFAALREQERIERTQSLSSQLFLEVFVYARKDVIFQPIHGSNPTALTPTGEDAFQGTGNIHTQRFPIPNDAPAWFAAFSTTWAKPQGETD